MTGLDKIINKINEESESECSAIIKSAQAKAAEIIAAGEKSGSETAGKIIAGAKDEAEKIIEIAKSGAEQQTKQALLGAKVEVLDEAIAKAVEALKTLPDELYFKAVIKIAAANAMAGKCKAGLKSADHLRMPADFEADLARALEAKGAQCTLSSEPSDIGSGIILDYGNIAVNCSFESVVEEKSDDFKLKISEILF